MATDEPMVRFGLEAYDALGWTIFVEAEASLVNQVDGDFGIRDRLDMPFAREQIGPERRVRLTLLDDEMGRQEHANLLRYQRLAVQYLGSLAAHLSGVIGESRGDTYEPIRSLILDAEHDKRGALMMYAEVSRPRTSYRDVSYFAGGVMRNMALKLRYLREEVGPEVQYADYLRRRVHAPYDESYMTLFADARRSSSLRTDTEYYQPDSQYLSLVSENLVSHAQQLICLAGVIAVANADRLAR